ncbi:hypothetical protein N7492_007243 [Penicillium capsulatum]|uniref:Fungal N-terminal domain-containing protein n=1 Tax=Penicillium capsulatum TaxID=69766 RepID=A0A9W9LLX0_9EURO|nr:hypothetical protein N7492_007243 [Penicillium capsulatum]KAJ6117081.1 hypothetical protein N7512_006806 [Penicillium capsulatum]
MDPVSAVSIAFTTLGYTKESIMKARRFIDRCNSAASTIDGAKAPIDATLQTIQELQKAIKAASQNPRAVDTVEAALRLSNLGPAMQHAQTVCENFSANIARFTSKSNDDNLCKRDQAHIAMRENVIFDFHHQLRSAQASMSSCLVVFDG